MNAQKKRLSLKESKKTELKKLYESKFEQEQEKLDALLKTTIATFEEREKSKKEHEIAKMIQNELKTEKEKRNAALSKEKEEFKQALDRRLENFKAILKEKYEAEKKVQMFCEFLSNLIIRRVFQRKLNKRLLNIRKARIPFIQR